MAIVAYPRTALLAPNGRIGARIVARRPPIYGATQEAKTVLYLPFSERGNAAGYGDVGTDRHHFLLNGPTKSVFWDPDFGGCLNFANNTSTAVLYSGRPAGTDWNMGSSASWAFLFWIKTTTVTQDIFAIQNTGNPLIIISVGANALGSPGATNRIGLSYRNDSANVANIGPAINVTDGAWHSVICGLGGNGWIYCIVDGTMAGVTTNTLTGTTFAGALPNLGGYTHPFTGKLKDFMFVNGSGFLANDTTTALIQIQRRGVDFLQVLPSRRYWSLASLEQWGMLPL